MPATKVRKNAKAARSAAKGNRVNKSAAVRKVLNKDPGAKPKQIAADLGRKGIKVTSQYVSIIKSKFNKQLGPTSTNGRRGKSTSEKFEIADLVEAKKFAAQIGGIDRAKSALSAIARLQ